MLKAAGGTPSHSYRVNDNSLVLDCLIFW